MSHALHIVLYMLWMHQCDVKLLDDIFEANCMYM